MNKTVIRSAIVVAGVFALAVAFWLIRPLFTDTVVDEDFPMSAGAVVPGDMTQADVEAEMVAAAGADPTVQDEAMPGDPNALVTGSFTGADDFHQAEGSATIYSVEGGGNILRLEDFEVTNGPDLHVYLAPLINGSPRITPDAVDLGGLKGNVGNQNYDIPDTVDLDQEWGVIIWCQPFRVTFGTAVLA